MTFGGPGFNRATNMVRGGQTKRDPKQIWIARGMEASINPVDYNGNGDFQSWFNFSAALSPKATFRDSYIGVMEKRNPIEEMSQIEKEYDWFEKDKDVCWMVSNCHSYSGRFDMASEIINHLPGNVNVHMWGTAFTRCMPKVNKTKVIDHGFTTRKTVEYEVELSKCKFYFAFENSICSDYITEKFSNPLALYAIPVVNGWRESYEQILPGSFIHVADFENNSRVAEHLSHLLGNKDEFFAYHKWRLTHEVIKEDRAEMYNFLHCRVCEKVYETREANKYSTQVSTISQIGKFFQTIQTCPSKSKNH
ncbi:4-galactosyl-N-acetylglucosaminide 3-alpha-L-fucosyltransferase 9-like [Convolutriloba macropyga]|uniref:4-galactosyl-N-acetylglucosaminide 3-alpha-L-fucosyltransferase 9-like n=1 Tax=Convolutriloba macropyga TaxID=536237 RepID=UPI003F520FF6